MPCEIVEKTEGHITVKISGILKRTELARTERVAMEGMGPAHKIKFLILVESSQGWDSQGDWGDASFQWKYDKRIEKIAIVGETRRQESTEAFVGKGLRSVDIRYFLPSETAAAEAWIK
ncbi:MAG: STAS/SEC14 domain-containing protein [Rubrivivax sp.]|nr:STAS/SEC14 domain-containing protein [Rubrivivax sp.]